MAEAFQSSRTGWGKTIILGTDAAAAPVSISSSGIKRGRSVTGVLLGRIKPKDDIPVLAHKYLDKELELGEFATHRNHWGSPRLTARSTCSTRGGASGASSGWTAPRRSVRDAARARMDRMILPVCSSTSNGRGVGKVQGSMSSRCFCWSSCRVGLTVEVMLVLLCIKDVPILITLVLQK
ncbi:hypothetical protein SEVIR_2G406250v4 [Setaria viridis]